MNTSGDQWGTSILTSKSKIDDANLFSTHLGDTVDKESYSNYEMNWSNWVKVMKSDKWRKVETLHS
jgi:hypothetical protein